MANFSSSLANTHIVGQQLSQFWNDSTPKGVALWADSSYGPLEEPQMLKLAEDLKFPLRSFNCSFGAGLTMKGDFHDPVGKPAEVVIIEMGYNDPRDMSPAEAANYMRQMKWHGILKAAARQVKFVVFVNQPSYRQVCRPRPKKKKSKTAKAWTHGALVDGSKWTEVGIKVVQELGIQALCLKASVQELFGEMLTIDADGTIWQAEAKCRSWVENGKDYSEDGKLALWGDSEHPTEFGAETHFRCLVNTFRARFDERMQKLMEEFLSNTGAAARPAAATSNSGSAPPEAETASAMLRLDEMFNEFQA